jgi:D-xylose transport system permease protein
MSTTPPDAAVTGESVPEGGQPLESLDAISPALDPVLLGGNELMANSLGEYVSATIKRIRNGESGVLPVVVGLVIIVVIFQLKSSDFLTARNLVALIQQSGIFVLFAMAEIFVLLLGEIDLSIGYGAGIGATVTAELYLPPHNFNPILAIVAGLVVCAIIGLVQGLLITLLGLPSFVVTLAGLLGLEGFLLYLINSDSHATGGTIQIPTSGVLNGIVNKSLSPTAGWIVMAAAVVAFAALNLFRDRRRRSSGLVTPPLSLTVIKIIGVGIAGVIVVLICNKNRGSSLVTLHGIPYVVPAVAVILIGYTFMLGRTKFGRYIYAIGGNAEAARRAGVSLKKIRTLAFVLSSLTGALAGIVYLSTLGSISSGIQGGNYVLYAVAAAVIGGTSLFGGRGKMIHAVLGGLVIATIYNGMGLINLNAADQEMVIALVLLAAVVVDAVARRGRSAT